MPSDHKKPTWLYAADRYGYAYCICPTCRPEWKDYTEWFQHYGMMTAAIKNYSLKAAPFVKIFGPATPPNGVKTT